MVPRFNPAPGWPAPPPGFVPPPGWQPDPGWPAAPPGWQFWVEDAQTTPPDRSTRSADGHRRVRTPGHRVRLTAFLLDAAIVACAFGVLVLLGAITLSVSGLDVLSVASVAVSLTACLAGVLGVTTWLTDGQSIGKAVCGLEVRRTDGEAWGGSLRDLLRHLARHSWGYLVIDVFGLGAATSLVTAHHRCLHDLAFGTRVARLPAPTPDAASLQARGRLFAARLDAGLQRSKDRYGWAYLIWGWLSKVISFVAKVVFGLLVLVTSIPWWGRLWRALTSESPTTPSPADGAARAGRRALEGQGSAAPVGMSAAATVTLWLTTAAMTAGLGAAAVDAWDGARDRTTIEGVATAAPLLGRWRIDGPADLVQAAGGSRLEFTAGPAPALVTGRGVGEPAGDCPFWAAYTVVAVADPKERVAGLTGIDVAAAWSATGRSLCMGSPPVTSRVRMLLRSDGRLMLVYPDADEPDRPYVMLRRA